MLIRLRRCIALDDGVTVVETMFAIMVLSIALFALMGSLIASARSQLEQRTRTQAIRVANEHLERSREYGFETLKTDLLAGCPAGSSCAPTSKTVGSQTYNITPTLTEVDASNPSLGPQPGQTTMMQVATDVAWSERDTSRRVSFATTVAQTKPDLTKDIVGIKVFPDPTVVSPTTTMDPNPIGQPTQDVVITAELKGLDAATPVTVSWTDDQGAKGPFAMTTTNAKHWSRTIPKASIRKDVPDGEDYGQLEFIVEVNIGGGVTLRQQQTLQVAHAVNPPSIYPPRQGQNYVGSQTFVSPVTIPLVRTGQQSLRGRNSVQVTFSAEVLGGLDPAASPADTVTAYWYNGATLVNGGQLLYDPSYTPPASTTGTVWRKVLPVSGAVFPQNVTNLTIYLQGVRASDGANYYVSVPVTLS